MRGKDFNTGLRGVLFEARHYEKMGAAVWLYGWLVLRQTHQHGDLGCVLGGSPICYREIEEETGFKRRTLECWMRVLRRGGYIETIAAPGGVVVRITKAKKFPQGIRGSEDGVRRATETVRIVAEGCTQNRVANDRHRDSNQENTDRIGSSFIVGTINKEAESTIPNHSHTYFHNSIPGQEKKQRRNLKSNTNSSGLGSRQRQNQIQKQHQEPYQSQAEQARQQYIYVREARIRWQQLRAEREEETRRELNVGAGPEIRRL